MGRYKNGKKALNFQLPADFLLEKRNDKEKRKSAASKELEGSNQTFERRKRTIQFARTPSTT
jgi:hypothetical protein